jgi:hypothetical protein
VVLERVLEASGLQKGREYDIQASFEAAEGGKARPDVIIRLPENKHVVVDSKVSLTAYEAYTRTEDELQRKRELGRHIAWDIGVAGLGRKLARALDATLILQPYSRLVIDCNRRPARPDSIAKSSEDTLETSTTSKT